MKGEGSCEPRQTSLLLLSSLVGRSLTSAGNSFFEFEVKGMRFSVAAYFGLVPCRGQEIDGKLQSNSR